MNVFFVINNTITDISVNLSIHKLWIINNKINFFNLFLMYILLLIIIFIFLLEYTRINDSLSFIVNVKLVLKKKRLCMC